MAQDAPRPTETQPSTNPSLAQLIAALHTKAHSLEAASGMRSSFHTFIAAHHLSPDSIRYSAYAMTRLLVETTPAARLSKLHLRVTPHAPPSGPTTSEPK